MKGTREKAKKNHEKQSHAVFILHRAIDVINGWKHHKQVSPKIDCFNRQYGTKNTESDSQTVEVYVESVSL